LLAALAEGAAVSVSGTIGFIGLVVPHLIRLMAGPDHRYVLPGSALLGALLLLIADLLARTVAVPAEVPIGILTAVLGGPFFLWLLLKQRTHIAF
jgi:iron complex transport system permease protein